MPENIDELKKLELLNEARKILNAEYNKKKSDEYNNWLLKNSNAIKSTNLHLPFPPFVAGNTVPYYVATVPYPTEHEVVAKAVSLYNSRYKTVTESPELTVAPVEQPVEPEEVASAEAPTESIEQPAEQEITTTLEKEPEEFATEENDELAGLQLRDAMIQEIYNIYGDKDIKDLQPPTTTKETTTEFTIEEALNTVPQPAEELSKIKTSNNSFASIYQKFQSMKNGLINPTDKGSA